MKRISIFLLFASFAGCGFAGAQDVKLVKATDVEKIIKDSKGPMIVNMWATWCVPCIEELPYFLEEVKNYNAQRGNGDSLQIFLVSLDFKESFPEKITAFAGKNKITAPIVWLDETNADYFCPKVDPKWSGAIPATLFINNKTGYRQFLEEQVKHEQLKSEITLLVK